MGAGTAWSRPRRSNRPSRPGKGDDKQGEAVLTDNGFIVETHTASDGYPWRYRRYAALGSARARVVCIHGIQSHGGWYEHSCLRLAEAGYEVFFLDRRGAGLNAQDRGDTPSFRRLLRDVIEFVEAMKRESSLKIFLVGISWGGKIAAGAAKRQPGLADGIALLCPGFYPRVSLSLREKAAVVWARLTRPTRLFPVPLSDPNLFTATEKWLKFLREDPLSIQQATARFLIASAALDLYLRDASSHIKVPVLLMLAGRDRIIDNRPTRDLVERFVGPKEIVEYADARHTLEFEPDPERHITDLLNWLRRQIDSSTPL